MAVRMYDTPPEGGRGRVMDARAANDRIARQAERLRFISRVPMLCECDRSRCRTIVMITLDDYYDLRRDPTNILTAPNHQVAGTDLRAERGDYAIHQRRNDQRAHG